MNTTTKSHLSLDQRIIIEIGLRNRLGAREIASDVGVSPSTVSREVAKNRTWYDYDSSSYKKLAQRCARYKECERRKTACPVCTSQLAVLCKKCKQVICTEACKDFLRNTCPYLMRWPYICPESCSKRALCGYKKARYSAQEAHAHYKLRLTDSRKGADISEEDLKMLDELITPLIKRGQSFEAILCAHPEIGLSVSTLYKYRDQGLFSARLIDFPRLKRLKKRARRTPKTPQAERIDRRGRTFDCFLGLSYNDRQSVVELDSVEGLKTNKHDILSMHFKASKLQLYFLKDKKKGTSVAHVLDALERTLGSKNEFQKIFGILLADRGHEFDNYEAIERSYFDPSEKRCRLFYCDAQNSNQKAEAERNHEQLRRILPKHISNFDKLRTQDMALITSHINSYYLKSLSKLCALKEVEGFIPKSFFEDLGIELIEPDDVILKPELVPGILIHKA